MRFSKTTGCFYPEDIEYSSLPSDIVTVSQSDFDTAMSRTSGETLDVLNGEIVIVPVPAPTLAQVQAVQIATLADSYGTAIQKSVDYMGITFQADNTSQDTLTKCLVAGSIPSGFFWLDANNAPVSMTYAQLQGLAGAMLEQGQTAFIKLQTLKAQVLSATTAKAVQAIVW